MSFYESIFIIKQDVSAADANIIADNFAKIVTDEGGKVVRKENWGLRSFAYKIQKNKKGHYIMLCIEANGAAIAEITRKARLSEDVLRNMNIKIDSISKEPSIMMQEAS